MNDFYKSQKLVRVAEVVLIGCHKSTRAKIDNVADLRKQVHPPLNAR